MSEARQFQGKFQGKPCTKNSEHIVDGLTERYTSNGKCSRCAAKYFAAKYIAHPIPVGRPCTKNSEHIVDGFTERTKSGHCLKCRTEYKSTEEYRLRQRVHGRNYYSQNKQFVAQQNANRNYGATPEKTNEMYETQKKLCKRCIRPFGHPFDTSLTKFEKLCFHHDHDTGKLVCLLCLKCNLLILNQEETRLTENFHRSLREESLAAAA